MTRDIKQSWFMANWNKPRRIKRHMKRYAKKTRNVRTIGRNSDQYKLEMPAEFKILVEDKASFYKKQERKLWNMLNGITTGEITQENHVQMIKEMFEGRNFSPYWVQRVLPAANQGLLSKIANIFK